MAINPLFNYSHSVNNKKYFFKINKVGFGLGAALLGMLTGCINYVDQPRQGIVYVAPPPVVQDDYVYYPNYQVYYSSSRHQYAYREDNAWVSRPAPRDVSVNVLLASPSVKMNFHDSPANHHAQIVQQYPKNWKPPGPNQSQKENPKDNQHEGNN
jgi:hypothetical protein